MDEKNKWDDHDWQQLHHRDGRSTGRECRICGVFWRVDAERPKRRCSEVLRAIKLVIE